MTRPFSLPSRNPVHGSLIRLGEWSMTRPVSLTCLEFNRPGLPEDSITESQDMGTGEVSSGDSSIHDYATHDEKYKIADKPLSIFPHKEDAISTFLSPV